VHFVKRHTDTPEIYGNLTPADLEVAIIEPAPSSSSNMSGSAPKPYYSASSVDLVGLRSLLHLSKTNKQLHTEIVNHLKQQSIMLHLNYCVKFPSEDAHAFIRQSGRVSLVIMHHQHVSRSGDPQTVVTGRSHTTLEEDIAAGTIVCSDVEFVATAMTGSYPHGGWVTMDWGWWDRTEMELQAASRIKVLTQEVVPRVKHLGDAQAVLALSQNLVHAASRTRSEEGVQVSYYSPDLQWVCRVARPVA